uniref:Fucolectin-like n=1 Tax=Crassostrea virginica TaxID=6565 RepID=A0A8B8BG78_CRAVI|nr:fucolectin-like [Crassostrea virginica]
MFSILLVLTLICLCTFQISIGHHPDLKNVAYSKKVTLSFRYHRVHYPGWNAVNGVLSDFAHSGHERSPWLRIDLGRNFRIHEIEVFARSDCCTHQLHDVDVKVGKRTHRMRLCGHITGYTRTGGRMAVWCPNHTVGRYVQIQIVKGVSNYLSPAEVVVWGKPVHGGF